MAGSPSLTLHVHSKISHGHHSPPLFRLVLHAALTYTVMLLTGGLAVNLALKQLPPAAEVAAQAGLPPERISLSIPKCAAPLLCARILYCFVSECSA